MLAQRGAFINSGSTALNAALAPPGQRQGNCYLLPHYRLHAVHSRPSSTHNSDEVILQIFLPRAYNGSTQAATLQINIGWNRRFRSREAHGLIVLAAELIDESE